MKAVFADTFYWVALTSTEDNAHEQALTFSRSLNPDVIVTTDEVLGEYLAYFSGAPPSIRVQDANSVTLLLTDPSVRIIPQSRESFLAGLELYRARPDKGYSLTDCTSMHTMRLQGLTEALTNDRHFEQEGFRAVFRS
jgi:predicted nucleic acid-binding protein